MLYALYETNRVALAPLRVMSEVSSRLLGNPFLLSSKFLFSRSVVAGAEVLDTLAKRRPKPLWNITHTDAEETVAVEPTVVHATPFVDLLRWERADGANDDLPRILLVAPMSGHYATLLRGTVQALIADHDVYVTDWVDAREIPPSAGSFGLEDYIAHVIDAMRLLGAEKPLHVMAVCQPAPPVLAAVALMAAAEDPAQPASMVLMGGPLDTAASPTRVTELADRMPLAWFEHAMLSRVPPVYRGGGRRVYPGFMQLAAFLSMNLNRHIHAHVDLFHHLIEGDGESAEAHNRFYDEYLSVMDTAAEFYLDTVRVIFQEKALPRGRMTWKGETVRPDAITKTALMTVEGELDDISAPGQTIAAHAMCSGIPQDRHRNLLQPGVGHYGIFNGRRWREQIKPEIGRFVRAVEAGRPVC